MAIKWTEIINKNLKMKSSEEQRKLYIDMETAA